MSICDKCANIVCKSDNELDQDVLYSEECECCENFIKRPSEEEIAAEAAERIRLLTLHPNVEKEWVKEKKINYSEEVTLGRTEIGVLYWLNNRPEFVNAVKEAEKEFGITVYHAIYTNTVFGELLACLYVGGNKSEWQQDKNDLECTMPDGSNQVIAYVINLSDPMLSEFGYIGIKEAGGGLIRVC